MTLHVKPEIGVEIPESEPFLDLKDRAEAASNTVVDLVEHGLDITPNKEDQENAAKLVSAYAEDPENTSKKVTAKRAASLTPASLLLTNAILKEFGQSVVESSVHIRNLVTNKLLLESDNPDPRIRMRALELLGKISDVGLFSEKSDITITHQSTDDLRDRLRGKLELLVVGETVIEGTVIGEIDVDAELGLIGEPVESEDYEEYDD
jgi:hypothetical protein|tara:strand:- start:1146 stop:1766 length:621 start_codon:yes stop_codon:yes gene_type:complete